jgi:ABC-type nitrate/sulfonate/bicarbonate transport system substrate-binding protein
VSQGRRLHLTARSMVVALLLSLTLGLAQARDVLRLGWQTPWATQGQLVAVMQRTNIAELVGLEMQYVGFAYGAPLNRAALGGAVDVLLTADQPAAALIDKGGRFQIVGRMMYNRTCMYVHPASRVKSAADLGRARLLGPSGAAAERIAAQMLRSAGVEATAATWGDLDMAGQSALIRGQGDKGWPSVDALYGFDPLPAVWEQSGKVRVVGCGRVVSFVVASRELIQSRPQVLNKFLRAFSLAWYVYAKDPVRANALFREIASLDIPDTALDAAAAVEPNKSAMRLADVDLRVGDSDRAVFAEAVDFLRQKAALDPSFNINEAFAPGPYDATRKSLSEWAGLAERIVYKPVGR